MNNLKNFINVKNMVALVLSFTMWIIYYATPYNVLSDNESYVAKSIVFVSVILSLLSSIYFINALITNNISKKLKIAFVLIVSGLGLSFLACKFQSSSAFLKEDYSLLALFSLGQIILLLTYGWRTEQEENKKIEKLPEGASNNDSEEDELDQTKQSLNIDYDK